MAPKRISTMSAVAVFLLVVFLGCRATAQSDCSAALMSLSSCLNYVTGGSSTPSSSCCSQLAGVVQSQPRCLCSLLSGGGGSSLGVSINQTLALALPGQCKVQTPPVSQCNSAAGGPAAEPSPATSPADEPETPAKSIPDIPSGTSSKTVPATGSASSSGTTITTRSSLDITIFALFLSAVASVVISI